MIVLICTEVVVGIKSSTGKETNQRYTGQYESCSDYTINIHILKKKYEHNTTRPRSEGGGNGVVGDCGSDYFVQFRVRHINIGHSYHNKLYNKRNKANAKRKPKSGRCRRCGCVWRTGWLGLAGPSAARVPRGLRRLPVHSQPLRSCAAPHFPSGTPAVRHEPLHTYLHCTRTYQVVPGKVQVISIEVLCCHGFNATVDSIRLCRSKR